MFVYAHGGHLWMWMGVVDHEWVLGHRKGTQKTTDGHLDRGWARPNNQKSNQNMRFGVEGHGGHGSHGSAHAVFWEPTSPKQNQANEATTKRQPGRQNEQTQTSLYLCKNA